MAAASGSTGYRHGRDECRPLSHAHLRGPACSSGRATIFSRSIHHALLMLIITLCLAPVSVSAHSAAMASELQSASEQIEDIVSADLQKRSTVHEITNIATNATDNPTQEKAIVTAGSSSSSQLPIAFDTIANNFANASCVQFFSEHLENSTVANCRPISLYLQNSNSFFHDLASDVGTSRVLDATCSDSVTECAASMNSLANELLDDDNCGQDYKAGNSVVQSTYDELKAYEPLYRATCLTNPSTKNYCFVDAVTNASVPNDYNVYFIPIGTELDEGELTCNECLKATMDIYAHWATIDQQSLDTTYLPSAHRVNDYCGAGFAKTNVTVGAPKTSAAALAHPLPTTVHAVVGIVFGAIIAWAL